MTVVYTRLGFSVRVSRVYSLCRQGNIMHASCLFQIMLQIYIHALILRGVLPPDLKLACFVCYLKIINMFFEKKKYEILEILNQNSHKIVLISNSRTAWPTLIRML